MKKNIEILEKLSEIKEKITQNASRLIAGNAGISAYCR